MFAEVALGNITPCTIGQTQQIVGAPRARENLPAKLILKYGEPKMRDTGTGCNDAANKHNPQKLQTIQQQSHHKNTTEPTPCSGNNPTKHAHQRTLTGQVQATVRIPRC